MIYVIGLGPGDGRYALPAAMETMAKCDVLAGYGEAPEKFAVENQEVLDLGSGGQGLKTGLQYIDHHCDELDFGVLVSGDPGFHSLLQTIRRMFPSREPRVIPGLSSFQLAAAKIAISWQELELFSLHSTKREEVRKLSIKPEYNGMIMLTGPVFNPGVICGLLKEGGETDVKVHLMFDLGTDREEILSGGVDELENIDGEGRLCIVIVLKAS